MILDFFILLLRFRSIINSCSYIGCLKRGVVKHFFKIASCNFIFFKYVGDINCKASSNNIINFFSCNFFSVKQDYYFLLFNFQLMPCPNPKKKIKKILDSVLIGFQMNYRSRHAQIYLSSLVILMKSPCMYAF